MVEKHVSLVDLVLNRRKLSTFCTQNKNIVSGKSKNDYWILGYIIIGSFLGDSF